MVTEIDKSFKSSETNEFNMIIDKMLDSATFDNYGNRKGKLFERLEKLRDGPITEIEEKLIRDFDSIQIPNDAQIKNFLRDILNRN